MPLSTAAADRG